MCFQYHLKLDFEPKGLPLAITIPCRRRLMRLNERSSVVRPLRAATAEIEFVLTYKASFARLYTKMTR